jgi:hypothetical protein
MRRVVLLSLPCIITSTQTTAAAVLPVELRSVTRRYGTGSGSGQPRHLNDHLMQCWQAMSP